MNEYIINVEDAKTLYKYTDFPFSLDAYLREEIVRCRDCKHSYLFDMSWKLPKTNDIRYCGHGTYRQYEVPDDGFCAWGERLGK